MTQQNLACCVSVLAVAIISCGAQDDLAGSLIASELALDASESLSVRRSESYAAAEMDYGDVALQSYVAYRLMLTALEYSPPGCTAPCEGDDVSRADSIAFYPPLLLTLDGTNHYSSGRRNIRTSYFGTVVCSSPAWGRDNNELEEVYVSGELALEGSDWRQIAIPCPGANAGPVEASLTLYQETD